MRPAVLFLLLLLGGSRSAHGQSYSGTYTLDVPGGRPLILALNQERSGRTTGTLSGNGTVIQLTGQVEDGGLSGQATMGASRAIFEAGLDGATLHFALIDLGPGGQPDPSTARELAFTRTGNAAAPAPRAGASPAPPPPRSPTTAPAPRAGAGTAQDQQLRQLLLSSAWCSFSYSQTSGSTSSSRSLFLPDGRLQVGSNQEGGTVNQNGGGTVDLGGGSTGSVYSQSQGGGTLTWQVQGGQLYVDAGQGMQLLPLTITRNSNGYPIITAAGKEYSQCN